MTGSFRAVMAAALGLMILSGPLFAQDTGSSRAREQWPDPPAALLEHARAILAEVPLVDGHNDLPSALLGRAGGDPLRYDLHGRDDPFMTDFARMAEGGVGAQFWSAYVTTDSMENGAALRQALREIDMVHRLELAYPDVLEPARTADDILRIHQEGKIASLIGVEGGHAIENSFANIRIFHDLGVRYMTLTHSKTTDWADAADDEPRHGGLTAFGEDVVREMNRAGIFVDLSHVTPATMSDALRVTRAPVIFSHSSARALTDVERNVPDSILAKLKENGGVVMATFVPDFVAPGSVAHQERANAERRRLTAEGMTPREVRAAMREWGRAHPRPRGTIADMADHIEHLMAVAGPEHVGIGSDFDGISETIVGLEDVSRYPYLVAELLRRGHSEAEVKGVVGLNLIRAMRRMEQVAAHLQETEPPRLAAGDEAPR